MERTLTVLFRRDPARDQQKASIEYEGYELLWPDGRPVSVGLEAFCKHGQRLLGLGRHLGSCTEKLIELAMYPLSSREDDLTRIKGSRVRRFFMVRQGSSARVHFMDGTPTTAVFDVERDEDRVVNWLGLPSLCDGGRQWFDIAARAVG
jgi:hypothetical protein